jgi:hypothetical protein
MPPTALTGDHRPRLALRRAQFAGGRLETQSAAEATA